MIKAAGYLAEQLLLNNSISIKLLKKLFDIDKVFV